MPSHSPPLFDQAERTAWAPPVFDKTERAAWAPPVQIKCSEWVETHRVLAIGESNIPGPFRHRNAPYLRGIENIANAPGVVQLNVQKAGQIGVSEATRNLLCFWAATDPDPVGLALPDRTKGRQIVREHVVPAFESTDAVRSLFTGRAWDISSEKLKLTNNFTLYLMWAGSASSTSSEPMRRVINDEVNKPGFRDWGGTEPNPIGRTWTRLRSFGDRKLQINLSTPTDRLGNITSLVESSNCRLVYGCPCPHCGEFRELLFPNLRWKAPHRNMTAGEREDLARGLEADRDVWYVCPECEKRIDQDEKFRMVRAGLWQSDDGEIKDAEAVERWPRGTRIGMQIGVLPCLWEDWSSVAAEFLRAIGRRERMYSFRTETLGEAWEQQVARPRAAVFQGKCARATLPEGVVPKWAVKLLATIDTQHEDFRLVIRAWGCDMKSQRVWHGAPSTFDELDHLLFQHAWANEDPARPPMRPEMVLIDSGGTRKEGETASRTMEVYRWAMRRSPIVRPIKGAGASGRRRPDVFIWQGTGVLDDGRGKRGGKTLRIWFIQTHHFADIMAGLIMRGLDEGTKDKEVWLLNTNDDAAYNIELSNVQKVLSEQRGVLVEEWMPIQRGAVIDYWDCENYQVAAAYMANVHMLPSQEDMDRLRDEAQAKDRDAGRRRSSSRRKGAGGWQVSGLSDYLS